jgi:hypothetical protein
LSPERINNEIEGLVGMGLLPELMREQAREVAQKYPFLPATTWPPMAPIVSQEAPVQHEIMGARVTNRLMGSCSRRA